MRNIDGIKRHGQNPRNFDLEIPSFVVEDKSIPIEQIEEEKVAIRNQISPQRKETMPSELKAESNYNLKSPATIGKKRKERNSTKPIFWLFFWFLLLAYILWSAMSLIIFSQRVNSETQELKVNIKQALSSASSMKMGETFEQLQNGIDKIHSTRLLIEKSGQNLTMLEYWPHPSKTTSKISALTLLDSSMQNIAMPIKGLSKTDDSSMDCGNSCLINARLIQKNLSDLNKGIDKSVSYLTKNLYRSNLPEKDKVLDTINGDKFKQAKSLLENLDWISGVDGSKKILVILQNNSELVGGSGGSFGSFATIDIVGGQIKKPNFGQNIFKLEDDSLAKIKMDPPETLYDGKMGIKESGIAVDGKEALKNIGYFYEQTTGENIDGVITIDVTAISKLFDVTGPIFMADYNKEINSSNLKDVLEEEVHVDYFKKEGSALENEPKKIIGDVMPIFMQRLIDYAKKGNKSKSILNIISESFSQKDILVYLENDGLENVIEKNNLVGQISNNNNDYLSINNSNMWTTKSSLSVKETVNLKTEIKDNGDINHSLEVTRQHIGKNEFPDGFNYNFTRVLLPKDAKVTSFTPVAGNFQIRGQFGYRNGSDLFWQDSTANKANVNFWFSTGVGATSKVKIDYTSNYKVDTSKDTFDYIVDLQKQPGSLPDTIYLDITYPEEFVPENVSNVGQEGGHFVLKTILDTDKTIKIRFAKDGLN